MYSFSHSSIFHVINTSSVIVRIVSIVSMGWLHRTVRDEWPEIQKLDMHNDLLFSTFQQYLPEFVHCITSLNHL